MTWLALPVNERASEGPVVSAVIYAAIVVMWAVVLVPMWLRRHDAATESRSVDRFSTAMRTLSRRTTSAPGRRYVVMPRRSEGTVSVHVSGAAVAKPAKQRRVTAPVAAPAGAPLVGSRPRSGATRTPGPAARRRPSLIARRRRLLLGLLAVTFLTFVLAAAGVISWPLQVVFDVILVAFGIHLRAQVRRAAAVSRQRRRATVASTRPAGRPAAPRPRQAPPPAAPRVATAVDEAPAETFSEDRVAATGTDDTGAYDRAVEDTWEPVPVPRPTYTLKAPAPPEVPTYEVDPLRDTDPHHTHAASYEELAADHVP